MSEKSLYQVFHCSICKKPVRFNPRRSTIDHPDCIKRRRSLIIKGQFPTIAESDGVKTRWSS